MNNKDKSINSEAENPTQSELESNFTNQADSTSSTEPNEKTYTLKQLYEKLSSLTIEEPNNPKNFFSLAKLFRITKNYKSGLENIEKCIQLNPKNLDYFMYKGDLHEQLFDFENALICYLEGILIDSKSKSCYYRLAKVCSFLQKYEDCLKYLDTLQELLKNDDIENSIKKSLDSLMIKDTEKSNDKSDELKDEEENDEDEKDLTSKEMDALCWELRGLVYKKLNNKSKAIEAYDKSIELNPDNYNVYYNKGVLYQDENDLEKAKEQYTKANSCKFLPNNNAWVNLADIYQTQDNIDQAILCSEKAIEVNPDDFEIIHNLGMMYYSNNDYEKALCNFLILTKDNQHPLSHSPEIYTLVANGYKKIKKYKESMKFYDESLEIDMYYSPAICGKANLLFLMEKYEESLSLCDKYVEKFPDNQDLLSQKANALKGLNLFEQSAKKRQRAETDEVTNITPTKRNKTNPDKLTIQLDQSKYTNIKNTVRNNLTKIQQLIDNDVEMQHKAEIKVKLKVVLEKIEDIFTPVDAAFIKKNK